MRRHSEHLPETFEDPVCGFVETRRSMGRRICSTSGGSMLPTSREPAKGNTAFEPAHYLLRV